MRKLIFIHTQIVFFLYLFIKILVSELVAVNFIHQIIFYLFIYVFIKILVFVWAHVISLPLKIINRKMSFIPRIFVSLSFIFLEIKKFSLSSKNFVYNHSFSTVFSLSSENFVSNHSFTVFSFSLTASFHSFSPITHLL